MDLTRAKYLLPNSLTMASAFCGFASIHLSLTGSTVTQFSTAAWLLVVAMFLDAFDGRVARMTKSESELGVQLDSLADAVSFGLAPAFLMYAWGLSSLGTLGLFAAFIYAAGAILRLARFNVMASQHEGVTRHFLGLPSPLAAGADELDGTSLGIGDLDDDGAPDFVITRSVGAGGASQTRVIRTDIGD